jgi:outer membrane protein
MKLLLGLLLVTLAAPSSASVLVQKTLEKAFNDKKAILKKDEDKIKKAQEDYKKQSMVLAEAARATKEQEIQSQMMALQNKTMEFQRDIQKMEQDLKKPILDKLRPIIDEVSKTNQVSLTFELSAAPIVYAEAKKDLTEDVIKAYDKKYPK